MSKNRQAIVVFVEVNGEGADRRDYGHRAEYAIRAALAGDGSAQYDRDTGTFRLQVANAESKMVPCDLDVTVHDVMEVGMASGNGYLWTELTSKAFPRDDD